MGDFEPGTTQEPPVKENTDGSSFVPHTIEALNSDTGQVEQIQNELIPSAVSSGKYSFDPKSKVKVFDQFGAPKTIAIGSLDPAMKAGYRAATTNEQKEYYLQKKYGDNVLEATAEGAARGLTLGLSDWALQGAGVSKERLREVKKRSPIAAGAGEIGAIAASTLIPGGQVGLLSKAGKAAGTIPRAIVQAGRGIEKKVAEKIIGETIGSIGTKAASKTLAKKIVETMAPSFASGAVEGAAFSMQNLISEDALGNKDLNAENIVSSIGVGALLGGAIGSTIAGAGGLLRSIRSPVAEDAAAKAKVNLDSEATSTATNDATANVQTKIKVSQESKDLGKFTKKDPKDVEWYKQNRDRIESQPHLGADLKGLKDVGSVESLEDVFRRSYDDVGERIKSLAEESNDTLANSGIVRDTQNLKSIVDDEIEKFSKRTTGYETEKAISRLKGFQEQLSKPGTFSATEIKDFIKELDNDLEGFYSRKLGGKTTTQSERALLGLRKRVSDSLKSDIPEYATQMDELSKLLDIQSNVDKNFSVNNAYSQRVLKTLERNEAGFQSGKGLTRRGAKEANSWMKAIDDLGEATNVDFRTIYKDRAVRARLFPELAEGAERGSVMGNLAKIGWDIAKYGVNPLGALKDIVVDQTLTMGSKSTAVQNLKQKALMELLSNQPTAKASGLNFLSKIASATTKQSKRLLEIVNGMVIPGAARLSPVTSQNILGELSFSNDPENHKDKYKQFEARRNELSDLVSDPSKIVDRLSAHTAGMNEILPNTTLAAQDVSAKAINYLYNAMPKDPISGELLTKNQWIPSDAELSKWERKLEAVNNPLKAFEDVANGNGSRDAIDAVKTVYPNIYQQAVMELTKKVRDYDKEIPYQRKLQLSMLIGAPLDYSMNPAFIQRMQEMYKNTEPSKQPTKPLSDALYKSTLSRSQELGAR